jgi:hypothetical protein
LRHPINPDYALTKKILELEHKSDKQYRELTKALNELIEQAEAVETRKISFTR